MVADNRMGEAMRAVATTPTAVMFITPPRLFPFGLRRETFRFIIIEHTILLSVRCMEAIFAAEISEAVVLLRTLVLCNFSE